MPILVQMLDQEMEDAKVIFQKQKQRARPFTDKNMPLMTGQLRWSQELRMKMSSPVKKFKELSHPVCFRPAAKQMFKKFKDMNKQLDAYEEQVYQAWISSITDKVSEGLQRHLVTRDPQTGALRNNFSNSLSSLLSEVSHVKKEFSFRYVIFDLQLTPQE